MGSPLPLEMALLKGDEELAKFLIQHNADINKCDALSIVLANKNGYSNDFVEYLIQKGANVNVDQREYYLLIWLLNIGINQ